MKRKRRMNKLEALAEEKFNGDLRAAWDYVLYEVTPEERDEYTKYVSKEQLDIGMAAIRRKAPGYSNEIDELAASKFNGDLKATWNYIFSTCSKEEIERYVSMADAHQAAMAVLLVDGLREKQPKRILRMQNRITRTLETLRVTREELLNMQNPYRIPLLKSSLRFVLVFAAIIGLVAYEASMGMDQGTFEAGTSILGIILSCCAFGLADKLRDYFRFRSVKKALEKEREKLSSEKS